MNDIKIFENEKFGKVRTAGTADNPLFCLADVCKAVELSNPSSVKSRLDKEDVQLIDLHALNLTEGATVGNTMATFVTECGFYDVILYSKSVKVKPFRKWVTSEVLPSIRKTGQYNSFPIPKTFAEALRLAADQQAEIEKSRKQLEEQKPKVKLAEAITTNEMCYPLKDLASILASKGVKIGPNRLRHFLKDNHYLGERGACYNMPRHQYIEQGLFIVTEEPYTDQFGHTNISRTVLVTGKGLEYFINKLYKEENK